MHIDLRSDGRIPDLVQRRAIGHKLHPLDRGIDRKQFGTVVAVRAFGQTVVDITEQFVEPRGGLLNILVSRPFQYFTQLRRHPGDCFGRHHTTMCFVEHRIDFLHGSDPGKHLHHRLAQQQPEVRGQVLNGAVLLDYAAAIDSLQMVHERGRGRVTHGPSHGKVHRFQALLLFGIIGQ